MTVRERAAELAQACRRLAEAGDADDLAARDRVIAATRALFHELGVGLHRRTGGGDDPARERHTVHRVETVTEHVVHDARRAAAPAYAEAEARNTGFCCDEPLEEEPVGAVHGSLDLGIPVKPHPETFGIVREERHVRTLTPSDLVRSTQRSQGVDDARRQS